MNIEKTLAACRKELDRQQEMEAKATPGPWGGSNQHSRRIDLLESDQRLMFLSRNLNPARLRVAEGQLGIARECMKQRKMDFVTEEPLRLAAALLGVEVIND